MWLDGGMPDCGLLLIIITSSRLFFMGLEISFLKWWKERRRVETAGTGFMASDQSMVLEEIQTSCAKCMRYAAAAFCFFDRIEVAISSELN